MQQKTIDSLWAIELYHFMIHDIMHVHACACMCMHERQYAYSPYQSSFSPEGADKESLCNNEKFLWSLQFVIMFLYLVTLLRDAGVIL